MKSSKISDLLDKINKAIENPAFPGISKLEHDLLMQHLRNLYEEVDTPSSNDKTVENDVPIVVKRPVIRPNEDLLIKEEVPVNKAAEPVKKVEAVVVKEEKVIENENKPNSKPVTGKIEYEINLRHNN